MLLGSGEHIFIPFMPGSRDEARDLYGMKMCSPLPGSTFSFEIEMEVQTARKSTYLSGTEKVLKNAFHWSCIAGQIKPLADLVPGQDDQYLPVTCTLKNKDKGVTSETELAYLPAAKLYLRLSTKTSTFRTLTELKSVEYE